MPGRPRRDTRTVGPCFPRRQYHFPKKFGPPGLDRLRDSAIFAVLTTRKPRDFERRYLSLFAHFNFFHGGERPDEELC